jgi:DNA-binding transcriptional LysR family regulator
VLGLGVHGALDGELDVGRLHLAPIVKAHPLFQEEGVVLLVGGVPPLRQPGHDLPVAIDFHQTCGAGGQVEAGRLRRHLHHEIALSGIISVSSSARIIGMVSPP